jgi:hypothetical protein
MGIHATLIHFIAKLWKRPLNKWFLAHLNTLKVMVTELIGNTLPILTLVTNVVLIAIKFRLTNPRLRACLASFVIGPLRLRIDRS